MAKKRGITRKYRIDERYVLSRFSTNHCLDLFRIRNQMNCCVDNMPS